MSRARSTLAALVLLALGTQAAGCAIPAPVRPWQHAYLSRKAMLFDQGVQARYRQHLFGAREGADGGYGHVGGGCGCN
jgi:hypothetical protein